MSQDLKRQDNKDFLLEHYSQVNQHLRETDRKRDTLFAIYLTVVTGALSFAYSANRPDVQKFIILGFLILFGMGVACYTTFARAWHCEYTRVAKAIHKSFLNGDLKLYKAAKAAKEVRKQEEDRPNPWHYFNVAGMEFVMMALILLFICSEVILLTQALMAKDSPLLLNPSSSLILICLSVLYIILVFGLGFYLYRCYLDKRESGFPENSWCILKEREDDMVKPEDNTLRAIESRLTNIEALLQCIETQLEKGRKTTLYQFIYSVGLVAMVAGMTLIAAGSNLLTGLVVFLVGLSLSIVSPFLSKRPV
jgi:hypothetical protein